LRLMWQRYIWDARPILNKWMLLLYIHQTAQLTFPF